MEMPMSYKWLDIAFSLPNPYDFAAFKQQTEMEGIYHELQEADYFQRLGMIQGRMAKDGVGYQEAYARIISDMNVFSEAIYLSEDSLPQHNCGGCKGGKVR